MNKTKAKLECRDIRTGVVMNEHSLDAIASPGYYKIEACDVSSSEGFPADVAQGRISAYLEVSVTNRRRDNLKSNTIGQTITLTDGSGTTAMYHRNSVNQGGKDVWEQWREVAGSNDLGLVTSLDSYIENGILRGTYTHDTTTEDFVLVVVNNSANGHGGTKRVSQYKYSLHAEGTVSNKVRVARIDGNSTIWGQWVDVAATGTNDIQDASITAAKLADDVRENVELVPDIHNRLAAQERGIVNGDIIVGQAREVYSRQGKTDTATFLKRTTAGGTTISDGVASIKQIGGNIVKNLVDGTFTSLGNYLTTTATLDTYNGIGILKKEPGIDYGELRINIPYIAQHKYYTSALMNNLDGEFVTISASGGLYYKECCWNCGTWQHVSYLGKGAAEYPTAAIRIFDRNDVNFTPTLLIKNWLVIDLTEMYGAGNEPTIEECDRMFASMGALPQGLTVAQPTALKSVGYNQWNPANVMPGKCIADDAVADNADTSIAIIECLPCKTGAGENNGYVIGYGSGDAWSDSAVEVYLTPLNPMKTEGELYLCRLEKDATYNTYLPGIAGYLLVVTPTTDKLCAHLHWSGDRAATDYEEYVESTVTLPQIPQMSEWGLAGIAANGTMVQDVIDLENNKYIKKIGCVDLGNLGWSMNGSLFVTNLKDYGCSIPLYGKVGNLISDKYTIKRTYALADENLLDNNIMLYTDGSLYLNDTDYSDINSLKLFLQGIVLYYELKNPEEYPIVTKSAPNYIGSDYGVEQFSGSKVPLVANILFYMRSLVSETRNFLDRLMAGLGSDVTAVADKIIAAVEYMQGQIAVNMVNDKNETVEE